MSHEILLRELRLGSEDKPFVVVGVLRTEGPTAIKAGNKAIILSDGSVDGWIGGHCTEDEIVSNALSCLKDGTSRFLNLTTCQGGRMDVYLEPYLPKRKLIVFGHVPIVEALAHLGNVLNFNVTVVDRRASKDRFPDADNVLNAFEDRSSSGESNTNNSQTYAVIATMGEFDVDHVLTLCKMNVPYIGVVAGKRRASEIFSYLRLKKVPEDQIQRVKAPAGIYIRAVTAEEIALSIMAEIVEIARNQNDRDPREYARKSSTAGSTLGTLSIAGSSSGGGAVSKSATVEEEEEEIFVDPVCGMTVEPSSSGYYSKTKDGRMIYFCCEECKESFDSSPERYILATTR